MSAGELVSIGSRQHVRLRTVVRSPAIRGNIARAHFIFGHAPGAMTARAQIAGAFVENNSVCQGHLAPRAQRKSAVVVRRMTGKTVDL